MSDPGGVIGKVRRDDVADLAVRDVMVHRPKTLPAKATVADLREHFTNPRVRTALLADGGRFCGAIAPEELPDTAAAAEPALTYAKRDVPSVDPGARVSEVLELMERAGDNPADRLRRRRHDDRRAPVPGPVGRDVLRGRQVRRADAPARLRPQPPSRAGRPPAPRRLKGGLQLAPRRRIAVRTARRRDRWLGGGSSRRSASPSA